MGKPEVFVIDYGVGNLLSVQRGFEHFGANVRLTANPEEILAAKKVVLPGVGAFENAMNALRNLGLVSVIQELGKQNTPILGICLGMQLLLDESEEFGLNSGLGLIPGRVVPVPNTNSDGTSQKIPHIGWSALYPTADDSNWQNTLLSDNFPGDSAYFVHSFMAVPSNPLDRLADCIYGSHKVAAAIGRGSITGLQFHPEKSGEVGLKILRQFLIQ